MLGLGMIPQVVNSDEGSKEEEEELSCSFSSSFLLGKKGAHLLQQQHTLHCFIPRLES